MVRGSGKTLDILQVSLPQVEMVEQEDLSSLDDQVTAWRKANMESQPDLWWPRYE